MITAIERLTPPSGPALKRISIVLAAILLPFALATVLSSLFYSLGDYKIVESVSIQTEYASIDYPGRKSLVPQSFTAKGTINKLPEKTTAYLMVKRDELYWPKKNLGTKPGQWSQEIKETKRKGSKLYLVVLALNSRDKQLINQWYAKTKETGRYPGIKQFATAQEIAAIEVKQK